MVTSRVPDRGGGRVKDLRKLGQNAAKAGDNPVVNAAEDAASNFERARGLDTIVRNAVIAAIIIGTAVAAYLLWATTTGDNYSVLYLQPDSYSNYIEENNTVKFTYGIQQVGKRSSKYLLDVYMGDQLLTSRDLTKRTGMSEIMLQVPENVKLPSKVMLILTTDYGQNEVHFWIKGRREENATQQ